MYRIIIVAFQIAFQNDILHATYFLHFSQILEGDPALAWQPLCLMDRRDWAPMEPVSHYNCEGRDLTKKRVINPNMTEPMLRTGFHSSLKMFKQTCPSQSMFGW